MQLKTIFSFLFAIFILGVTASAKRTKEPAYNVQKEINDAAKQYEVMIEKLGGQNSFPQYFDTQTNELKTSNSEWWCSGFYPGSLFLLAEQTGKKILITEGERMLNLLKKEQYNISTHDIGFMMYCSFGNANRLQSKNEYKDILINSAKSLSTRYSPLVGCIKSHNRNPDDFIVIIDNMMNLELLFWATQETGDSTYYKIAVNHANTTLENHFRSDCSVYHAINYDQNSGAIKKYIGGQGYAEKSAWARGQSWALYGYTLMYRMTKDKKYLNRAVCIAEYILNHPNLPKDKIPYWDFNAPNIPNELRDASAAAINCSALLELSGYVNKTSSKKYQKTATQILKTLSTPEYKANIGENGGFILKHSVGNIPASKEIDVPLSYADYYYIEALCRYQKLESNYAIITGVKRGWINKQEFSPIARKAWIALVSNIDEKEM